MTEEKPIQMNPGIIRSEIKPQIIIDNFEQKGYHNINLEKSRKRLSEARTYKDLSTICIIPTRGLIHFKVVQSWMNMMTPMNQKFVRMFVYGMEVGEAYSQALEIILSNLELAKWKYIITVEEDNMPPPDGILKLYESMEKYDIVGGLYWTKGEGGQPMIYGNPQEMPLNFIPQVPLVEQLQECNGLGMGFTLFKLDIFKDQKIPKPFFKTMQDFNPYQGTKAFTQDLYFFNNIHSLGYKVACDNRVKVGHYDPERDIVW